MNEAVFRFTIGVNMCKKDLKHESHKTNMEMNSIDQAVVAAEIAAAMAVAMKCYIIEIVHFLLKPQDQ